MLFLFYLTMVAKNTLTCLFQIVHYNIINIISVSIIQI